MIEKAFEGNKGFPKRSSKMPYISYVPNASKIGSKCKLADGSRADTSNFKQTPQHFSKREVYTKIS
jgi:hypothetical protein